MKSLPALFADIGRPVSKVPVQSRNAGHQAFADQPVALSIEFLEVAPVGVVTDAPEIGRQAECSPGLRRPRLFVGIVVAPPFRAGEPVVELTLEVKLTVVALLKIAELAIQVDAALAADIGCNRGIPVWGDVEIVGLAVRDATATAEMDGWWQQSGAALV